MRATLTTLPVACFALGPTADKADRHPLQKCICHPIMIRLIMHLFDGLPLRFNRADLEKFCQEKTMAILRPIREQDASLGV